MMNWNLKKIIAFTSMMLVFLPLQTYADETAKGGIDMQFTASSMSIHKGDAVTFSWQSNAEECAPFAYTLDTEGTFIRDTKNEWSQGSSGLLSASGTQTVHPSITTLYVLECLNKKENSFENTRNALVVVDGSKPAVSEAQLTISNVKMNVDGPIAHLSFEYGNARISDLSFFGNLIVTKDGKVLVQSSLAFAQKPQDTSSAFQTLIMEGDTLYSYTLDLEDPLDGRMAHYEGTFQTGANPLDGQKVTCVNSVTQKDLFRIPFADFNLDSGKDSAGSGLSDDFKMALGLDQTKSSTNGNGYDDRTNLLHGYDPITPGNHKLPIDHSFAEKEKGCFLDEQISGKEYVWYVHPTDSRVYYVGNPTSANDIDEYMKDFGMQKDERAISLSLKGFTKKQNPFLYVVPQEKSLKGTKVTGKTYTLNGITFKAPWKDNMQKHTAAFIRFTGNRSVSLLKGAMPTNLSAYFSKMNYNEYVNSVLTATPEEFYNEKNDDTLLTEMLTHKYYLLDTKPSKVYAFQTSFIKGFYFPVSGKNNFEAFIFKGKNGYQMDVGGASDQQMESLLLSTR